MTYVKWIFYRQTGKPVQSCNSRHTHCRPGKGFDRFSAVIDLHGYVNAAIAIVVARFRSWSFNGSHINRWLNSAIFFQYRRNKEPKKQYLLIIQSFTFYAFSFYAFSIYKKKLIKLQLIVTYNIFIVNKDTIKNIKQFTHYTLFCPEFIYEDNITK